jgi:hypothetical protein
VESATAPPATSPSCGQQPLRRPGGPRRSSRQRAAEGFLRRARFFGTHAPRDKERDDQLRQHLAAFLDAYNFAKRLKTLKGLTPFESICKVWTNEPNRFKHEPIQFTSGLHT